MKTKVLSYIYIREYKHLKNVGIKFDNAYDINYDVENNLLSITNSNENVPNMYGKGILSLTAIVGNNGVGKTTCLSYILDTLVPGRSEKTPPHALFVWRDGDSFYYYNSEKVQFAKDSKQAVRKEEVESFVTLLFSSEFDPGANAVEWSGSYKYTNMALLNNDIQSYANIDSHYNDSYQQRLNAYMYQNMFRIAGLIANYRDELGELNFNVPQYIMLYPNRSAYLALHKEVREREDLMTKEILEVANNYMGNDMFCILFHSILNKCYDFNSEFHTLNSFAARFFDLLPTFKVGEYCKFSSGENQIYNMLSRIIYAKENASKFEKKLPQILLLDEMETGLHPEWQKEFISVLTKFINKTFGISVQIIMTTHSPIILSDLLRTNVQYLQRTKDGRTENVSAKQKDTFASNIFDLYKNAFFLENGFIGKYAMSMLTELDKKLREMPNDINRKDASLIHNIGDNRIKCYFINLANIEFDKEKEIKMLEKRIRELKGEER